jgi:hypothetical protein
VRADGQRGVPARVLAAALMLGLAGAVLPGAAPALGQAAPAPANLERSVKAAFLYKFLAYTEFAPGAFADSAAPLTIGVVGADELALELARIVAGRSVDKRTIVVKALRDGDSLAGLHLLFVAGGDEARAAAVLKAAQAHALLTVTEADGALQSGSVINFRIVDDHVRFEVSLEAAARNGIKLSSRLLSVAYAVNRRSP